MADIELDASEVRLRLGGEPVPIQIRAHARCPCEGKSEIRRVPEPVEYAVLSPEHEDYLRAQIAHR